MEHSCWQATIPLLGSDGQLVALTDHYHLIASPVKPTILCRIDSAHSSRVSGSRSFCNKKNEFVSISLVALYLQQVQLFLHAHSSTSRVSVLALTSLHLAPILQCHSYCIANRFPIHKQHTASLATSSHHCKDKTVQNRL